MQNLNINGLVEIIPSRLFWLSDKKPPEGLHNAFYFSVDSVFKYSPYLFDFGPLNIASVIRFGVELDKLLSNESFRDKTVFHYTSDQAAARVNAAFIMGAYMVS